jgi:hypothetical protein
MGPGRRMKKQGPPAPLDESKITLSKYAAGAKNVDSAQEQNQNRNQRKRKVVDTGSNNTKGVLENGNGNGKKTKRRKKSISEEGDGVVPLMSGGVRVPVPVKFKSGGKKKVTGAVSVNGNESANGVKGQKKTQQKKAQLLVSEFED